MLLFFIINLLDSFLLFLYFSKRKLPDSFIRFLIMSSLPVGGLVLFITLDICKSYMRKCNTAALADEVSGIQDYTNLISTRTEINDDTNIVPIQDALIFNDNTTKRILITKVLMDNPYKYIKVLTKAVRNNDTETSHYAAAAVAEIKRNLVMNMSTIETEFRNSPDNIDIKKRYAGMLLKYIESGLSDEKATARYLEILSSVLGDITNTEPDNESCLEQKVRCEIDLKRYCDAISSCREYICRFSKSDIPYILLMKIYYITRDRTNFRKTLIKIQDLNLNIRRESLKIIRFWS